MEEEEKRRAPKQTVVRVRKEAVLCLDLVRRKTGHLKEPSIVEDLP